MQYDFIDKYNDLRDTIDKMITADSTLMGDDAWLVHVTTANDMTLYEAPDYITASGVTYTMQTMSLEHFSFDISKADIELFQIKQLLGPVTVHVDSGACYANTPQECSKKEHWS